MQAEQKGVCCVREGEQADDTQVTANRFIWCVRVCSLSYIAQRRAMIPASLVWCPPKAVDEPCSAG